MTGDMTTVMKQCGWCQSEASLTCGQCSQVYYCCREHQKTHWSTHKSECRPYKIAHCPAAGRYLVSTRFLPAGSLVLKESPFALGPKASSPLVCLACHEPIAEREFQRCSACHWPVCSPACSTHEAHREECRVLCRDMKQCGVPQRQGETPRYDLILTLRCLLLRSAKPTDWGAIESMESHSRRRKEDAEPHHMAAIRYLTEVCKVDFDVDTVHHVRGAIVTNSINTQTLAGVTLRGLYATVCLLNHSCHPNVTLRSDTNHNLFIRTAVDVHKGEPLLFSYIQPTDPIWTRQQDLMDVYYFSCKCTRCSDPTEMQTYFSSPRCPKCTQGYLIPNTPDLWKCPDCGNDQSLKAIKDHSKDLMEWIKHKKMTTKHLKLFLKGIAEKCHKKHFLYFEALQKVLAFLKNTHSHEANTLKKETWEELIQLLSAIEPGLTRRRGICLVEFSLSTLRLYEVENGRKKKSEALLRALIEEASTRLTDAHSILVLEPDHSTEERWKQVASHKLDAVTRIKSKRLSQHS